MTSRSRVLVLGAGAWGSALAIHLARQPHDVVLWGHCPEEINVLQKTHYNPPYLPDILFPRNIQFTSDLAHAFQLAGKDANVLVVVPSFAFDETTQRIAPFLNNSDGVIWATKGLSEQGEFLHSICEKNLGERPMAVLSGPSFAKEVALQMPTAVTIAANNQTFAQHLSKLFHHEKFRIYLSNDMIGVQLGGAIKNVLAIAVGMSDGLGFGANARSALITRGLAELCRLGEKLGAQLPTLMGLAGVGDMVLTCTDNQSRNRRFGMALGQGQDAQQALQSIGQVVEGYQNVKQVKKLLLDHQVDMPICEQVYAVLFERVPVAQAVQNILARQPKLE